MEENELELNKPWLEQTGEQFWSSETYIGVSKHGTVLVMEANLQSTFDTVESILDKIDRAKLDPVRVAARELYESIASNDEGQDFSKETMAMFEKLKELL